MFPNNNLLRVSVEDLYKIMYEPTDTVYKISRLTNSVGSKGTYFSESHLTTLFRNISFRVVVF